MNKNYLIKYVIPLIIALLSLGYFFSREKVVSNSSSIQIPEKKTPTKPKDPDLKLNNKPVNNLNTATEEDSEAELEEMEKDEMPELPEDLRIQLESPPPELPEDMKKQLTAPEPEMPIELKQQYEGAPPPPLPEDIQKSLMDPTRGSNLKDVNPNP
jgi:hypothetical protein